MAVRYRMTLVIAQGQIQAGLRGAVQSAGGQLLAIPSSINTVDDLQLSYWANLKQHLTTLSLHILPEKGDARHLGTLSMLTALQSLTVSTGMLSHCAMSGETLALKLPQLTFLNMSYIGDGELVLSCPKLAVASFYDSLSLRIVVEEAALAHLTLRKCQRVDFALTPPRDQLLNLVALSVLHCSEVGRSIIRDVSQMRHLQTLEYNDFPVACMPTKFPHGLQNVALCPLGWEPPEDNIPAVLKELHMLDPCDFDKACESRDIPRSIVGLLHMDSLDNLELGWEVYFCVQGGRKRFEKLP